MFSKLFGDVAFAPEAMLEKYFHAGSSTSACLTRTPTNQTPAHCQAFELGQSVWLDCYYASLLLSHKLMLRQSSMVSFRLPGTCSFCEEIRPKYAHRIAISLRRLMSAAPGTNSISA